MEEKIEVRAWSTPKPQPVGRWRYAIILVATLLAGWLAWEWAGGRSSLFPAPLHGIMVTGGVASTVFLAVNVMLGKPFRD